MCTVTAKNCTSGFYVSYFLLFYNISLVPAALILLFFVCNDVIDYLINRQLISSYSEEINC